MTDAPTCEHADCTNPATCRGIANGRPVVACEKCSQSPKFKWTGPLVAELSARAKSVNNAMLRELEKTNFPPAAWFAGKDDQ